MFVPGPQLLESEESNNGVLVVRVLEPADRGKATEASLRAIAKALAIPRRSVKLVRGSTSRRTLLDVEVGNDEGRFVEAIAYLRQVDRH